MARARCEKRCEGRTRSGTACAASAVFDGRCKFHGGSGTNARPPWTLTATPDGLGAYPDHPHPREPHERRRIRPLLPCSAAALVRRGVITRAVALAGSTRLDRFLRRLGREGVEVLPDSSGELVRAFRFRLAASEAT